MKKAKLYLIPNTLGDEEKPSLTMGSSVYASIENLHHFAVENLKVCRRYFVRWGLKHKIDESRFVIHNKKNAEESLSELKEIFNEGHSIGMISDAGCPGIADPGNQLVQLAHSMSIQVIPLTGPSSIFLALMASGMNGQNFRFHGYLPIEKADRSNKIKELEVNSKKESLTQIFMETPYRNDAFLTDLINTLTPNTKLCVASDLTTDKEIVITKLVRDWKEMKQIPSLNKKPTIFLLLA